MSFNNYKQHVSNAMLQKCITKFESLNGIIVRSPYIDDKSTTRKSIQPSGWSQYLCQYVANHIGGFVDGRFIRIDDRFPDGFNFVSTNLTAKNSPRRHIIGFDEHSAINGVSQFKIEDKYKLYSPRLYIGIEVINDTTAKIITTKVFRLSNADLQELIDIINTYGILSIQKSKKTTTGTIAVPDGYEIDKIGSKYRIRAKPSRWNRLLSSDHSTRMNIFNNTPLTIKVDEQKDPGGKYIPDSSTRLFECLFEVIDD